MRHSTAIRPTADDDRGTDPARRPPAGVQATRGPGERFEQDLHEARSLADGATRRAIAELVRAHAAALASQFIDTLLRDPHAGARLAPLLGHERLRSSTGHWLQQLFDPTASAQALEHAQRMAGELHGRCRVSQALLTRAQRVLKRAIVQRLAGAALGRLELLQGAQFVEDMLTLAFSAMAVAAAAQASRMQRSDEAYRLSFIGRDLRAECEQRCRELLEWTQWALEQRCTERPGGGASDDEPESFPLWLRHKAGLLFDGAPELELIARELRAIEALLQASAGRSWTDPEKLRRDLQDLRRATRRSHGLVRTLFDRHRHADGDRDPGTPLLHRRYFASIAQRELVQAHGRDGALALLMIELDAFEPIVTGWGVKRSNVLLAQLGALLQEHVRAGDFVFRLGEATFLVLLVECDADSALRVAEGLARRIADTAFTLSGADSPGVTACIGVAPFNGECDHQRLVERADDALRQAQAHGAGQCAVAASAERTVG